MEFFSPSAVIGVLHELRIPKFAPKTPRGKPVTPDFAVKVAHPDGFPPVTVRESGTWSLTDTTHRLPAPVRLCGCPPSPALLNPLSLVSLLASRVEHVTCE